MMKVWKENIAIKEHITANGIDKETSPRTFVIKFLKKFYKYHTVYIICDMFLYVIYIQEYI